MSKDRRQYSRVAMLEQAVIIQGDTHCLCRLQDVSAGGAAVVTDSRPAVGVPVTLFADEVGRFDASVVRHTERGLALRFIIGEHKCQRTRDKLTDYIHWISARSGAPGITPRQRLLLEALALSGRVAAPRKPQRVLFWQTVHECQKRGWVKVDNIGTNFAGIEITFTGREHALRAVPETVA